MHTELVELIHKLKNLYEKMVILKTSEIVGGNVADKIKNTNEEIGKTEAKVNSLLAEMREKKDYITLKDIIEILDSSDENIKYVINAIDESSSPVTYDMIEYILHFVLNFANTKNTYRDVIYLMARAIDSESGKTNLTDLAVEI